MNDVGLKLGSLVRSMTYVQTNTRRVLIGLATKFQKPDLHLSTHALGPPEGVVQYDEAPTHGRTGTERPVSTESDERDIGRHSYPVPFDHARVSRMISRNAPVVAGVCKYYYLHPPARKTGPRLKRQFPSTLVPSVTQAAGSRPTRESSSGGRARTRLSQRHVASHSRQRLLSHYLRNFRSRTHAVTCWGASHVRNLPAISCITLRHAVCLQEASSGSERPCHRQ
ncbi:hypothetical protein BV20DRAFT_298647 [Pilatotrama ljubarskyi]|nr:hypothetical protein BV20DRAFT_298647 [Pilatotrama ljubarskyi]